MPSSKYISEVKAPFCFVAFWITLPDRFASSTSGGWGAGLDGNTMVLGIAGMRASRTVPGVNGEEVLAATGAGALLGTTGAEDATVTGVAGLVFAA